LTREEIRQSINARPLTDFITLTRSQRGGANHFNCPACGSGTRKNQTGALTLFPDTNRVCCFNPVCDLGGKGQDTLGALRILWNCSELEVFKRAGYSSSPAPKSQSKTSSLATKPQQTIPTLIELPDLTDYYRECQERLNDPRAISYLQARGISLDTAAQCGIGFDPKSDPTKKNHPEPRIICPSTSTYYMARSINPATKKDFQKLNNIGAKPAIFNSGVLHDNSIEKVFVTEGAFDALSIIEAGAAAIALNGANNADKLIEHLSKHRTNATLILCKDNDPAGQKALEILQAGLRRLNISYVNGDVNSGHKDPNEALTADRAAFIAAVQQLDPAKPDNVVAYMNELMSSDIDSFRESRDRKTGFAKLDEKAKGLYAGLYVIGAISSLGKTTFCTQLADQLATAGEDVLFFSLEQSRLELVSKSIARRTAQKDMTTAVDSLSIRRGYLPSQVLDAAREYKDAVSDRISIIEGNFACNISFIGDYIRRYIRRTGTKPVIFIDYLQILQPEKDDRGRTQSTKETVDTTMTELKRISREHGLTVFVISSINRSNYLSPIDFESFKESGGIEYTADVVWGLQLQCMNDDKFSDEKKNTVADKRKTIKEAKQADPRKIELVCLKNRYGISSYSCYFDYFPKYDLYIETQEPLDLIAAPKRTPAKPTRQQEIEKLISAFKEIESPIERNTASLESLADKLDLKIATLKRKLKELTTLFSIKGDRVTYYPEGKLEDEQTDFETMPF
jgi:Replicative DNA helicase